jgi:Carboxypeptidase regulatory-like domain/TonB dependent receptor
MKDHVGIPRQLVLVILGSLFLLLNVGAPVCRAQGSVSIGGTITDSSGAIVPGAAITATNKATGEVRSVQSNSDGVYLLSSLVPGLYDVDIAKSGMKTLKFAGITLSVDQKLTLDAKLEISQQEITVVVEGAQVAPIDTTDAQLSSVVNHEQMTQLPLILRDPYQLVLLSPGVTQSDSGLGGVSINGGRERNNNFMLDGTDNNDADVPGILGGLTSQNPDSTQEFRVITNNFAPEYGRNNGAIIDVITRSGGNEFHGDAFYFGRWDALGARDYFNHQINPLTDTVAPKNPYVRNLYGGSLGGPIKKDKTFFFINYQGDRFVTSLTNTTQVPTASFKSGVFAYTNPLTGASQNINVTTPMTNNNATGVGLDPSVAQIFSHYPTPNIVNSDQISGLLFFPTESRERDEDATIKVDQKIGKNHDLYVRYVYNWFRDPDPFHSDTLPNGVGAIAEYARTQSATIGLTSTFGSTLANEFRFGMNRNKNGFTCNGAPADAITNAGGDFLDPYGRGADFNLPSFTTPGVADYGCTSLGDSNGQDRHTGTYQTLDYVTKSIGTHTIKWGGEFRDVYSNNNDNFSSRQAFAFNVNTDFGVSVLQNLNPGVDNLTLEDEVSGLLGIIAVANQTQYFNRVPARQEFDELNFVQHELGLFIQDEWKLKPNLSITYGLRWEWYGVPYERSGILSNLLEDPSGTAPLTFSPVGPGTGQNLYNPYYADFQPRVGFAWDPFKDGRTSVRGGFGVFSDRVYGNLFGDARGNPPFQPSYFNYPYFSTGLGPETQLQNQTAPPEVSPSPMVVQGTGIFPDIFAHGTANCPTGQVCNNIRPPLITTWNIGVQRELVSNLVVEADYVGNHGTRILRVVDGAPPQPALVQQLEAFCVPTNPANTYGCSESTLQFTNLFFGAETFNPATGMSVLPFDAVNNNAFVDAFYDETSGHSWYDGLQLQVTERAFHRLQIQGSYTWSHALDDSSDPLVTTSGNGNFPINSFDLRREKGNSGFDTRQRLVINFIYGFGVGRGTSHLNEGVVGRVFEGWELSGIAAFQTGLPYDIFGTADTLHTNIADRATVVNASLLKTIPSTGAVIPSSAVFTGENFAAFNPDDPSVMPIPFDMPSNVGRNHWYGPGINNWNFNLAKTTSITEKVAFQLRFEFYNLFNRTQFAKPGNIIGSPTFGYSTSEVGQNDGTTGARQVQIAGKITF